jgi:putative colanic acid biosynthesis acetyltransferase WcaF
MVLGRTLLRLSLSGADGYRCWVLRRFGAKTGRHVRISRTCHIEIPWTLEFQDGVSIGERAILYSLGPITIGEGSTISRFAHLCAGTHDYSTRRFVLLRPPISIGRHCWIGPDAFVGPGVRVADGAVLEPRACAFSNLDANTIYAGNPARALRPREPSP